MMSSEGVRSVSTGARRALYAIWPCPRGRPHEPPTPFARLTLRWRGAVWGLCRYSVDLHCPRIDKPSGLARALLWAWLRGYRVKARHLIGGAAFPPDELKVIFEAFDDAWDEVAPDVSARASAVEDAD